jgi:hypothetical protein
LQVKQTYFWHPVVEPMGSINNMTASRSFSKISGKLNLQLVSNIEFFPTHIGLKLGVLGVVRKF